MQDIKGFLVKEKWWRKFKTKHIILSVFLLIGVIFLFLSFKFGTALNNITVRNEPIPHTLAGLSFLKQGNEITKLLPVVKKEEYVMPSKEENRIDILLLGIRGKDDPDGGLLADSIVVFSFDKITKKSVLISIPRDLYIWIPTIEKYEKINSIYAIGYNYFNFIKNSISKVTGVYIDHLIVVNFEGFTELIDIIGGIDITLAEPFEEPEQWKYPFTLPAGENHLNSEQTLYYVRSRYSTSDFDRAHRQQQVIFAIRDKLFQLGILANPLKLNGIIETLEKNVKTDIGISDAQDMVNLLKGIGEANNAKRYVITTENLLYEKIINDIYVLLPRDDSLVIIKDFFRNILK